MRKRFKLYHSMVCFSSFLPQNSHPHLSSPFFHGKSNPSLSPPRHSLKLRFLRCSNSRDDPKLLVVESSQSYAGRFSRAARNDAQRALFEYLHCTRGLGSTDAEHISKNSPHFVGDLLCAVQGDDGLVRSLSKFLRYNPINEFEPFFESLGISQQELPGFLPQNMMFLSDDQLMLENFAVLSGYGVPRSKMGKIFEDAREIFRYNYGVLSLKLRAYENLGLSKFTVIKLVLCCPSLLVDDVDAQFVKVLEKLSIHGIEKDGVGQYLSDKNCYNWGRIVDTIEFIENFLFEEEQMGVLFRSNPSLLFSGSGKKIYVLLNQLIKVGISVKEARQLFTENPHLITQKCLKNFSGGLTFLVEIGMDMDTITVVVSTHVKLLASHFLRRPLTVFRHFKLTRESLSLIIKEDPLQLFILASKSKLDYNHNIPESNKQMEKRAFLLNLGYVENSEEMTKALKQFRGRGDQLQERFDCLVESGLDFNMVSSIVKQVPTILNQTRDVIEKKIDFLTKQLGYPIEALEVFPAYLCYDMERISMYMWLRERGKAKPMLSLSTVLACSDSRFVHYFVDLHPEAARVWENLKSST